MDAKQLREYVIRPTLNRLDMWSDAAEKLLLGTAAHESCCGEFLHQVGGPALGIYQIEPATHKDVWDNFLRYKSGLMLKIQDMIPSSQRVHIGTNGALIKPLSAGSNELLITDLSYATAIARIIYLRAPTRLPDADDLTGIAEYWKKHYNTPLGKGTVEKFLSDYAKYIGD